MKEQPVEQTPKKTGTSWQFTVLIAASLVTAMIVYIPLGPVKKYRDSKDKLAELRDRYTMVEKVRVGEERRLRDQEQLMALLKERKPGFELWAFMNTVLTDAKLREHADLQQTKVSKADKKGAAVAEGVAMVQLKLVGISLQDLVTLLHSIYASNNLIAMYRVDYIKAATDNKGIDCSMVFLTPKAGAAT